MSANSTSEIDNLICELQLLREKLLADGNRVERDIVEYAALSQSVIEMTKIITESMTQVKQLPAAPTLPAAFVNEDFAFNKVLSGQQQIQERWKRCVRATDQALSL